MRVQSREVALLAVVAVLMAACGGATPAPAASTAASATSAPAASAATSPNADLAALEKAAKQEGAVTFYTASTSTTVNNELKKAFEAKYPGITLTTLATTSAPLKTKLQAEIDAKNVLADVVTAGEHTIFDKNVSALATLSDLASWKSWPEKYRTATYALTSIQAKPLLINTKLVKPGEITKWSDLTNPKWKGLITMTTIGAATSVASFYITLDKTYGDDFIRALAAMKPNFQSGAGPQSQLVASGEAAIALGILQSVSGPLKASGAPVDSIDLDPEPGVEYYTAAMKGPHPNAGRLLVNYMLTAEGQKVINGNQLGSSPLPDVPTTTTLPKGYVQTDESITQAEIDRVGKLLGSP